MRHRHHPTLHALPVAFVAVTVLLSGCGTTDGSSSTPSGSQPASAGGTTGGLPAAEGKTTYPLTLRTPWGSSQLAHRPVRIASVSPNAGDTDLLLSLGVAPVTASGNGFDQAPWLQKAAAGRIETVYQTDKTTDYPFEKIAAAKPDLIVVFGYDLSGSYDKLAAIAPVLSNPTAPAPGTSTPWQDSLALLGKTLDLSDAATSVVRKYDSDVAELKRTHPAFQGKTASYGVYYGNKFGFNYYSTPGSDPARALESLGFRLPAGASAFTKKNEVSNELISKIDADVLLVHDVSGSMGAESLSILTSNPLFQNLSAVKNKRLITTPATSPIGWALSNPGPLATKAAFDELVPLLAQKLP